MRYALNQLQFEQHWTPRNAAVHFEPAQRSFIPQRNAGRPKNMKAESRSAFGNCRKIVCLVIGQGDHRNEIRYLKIDRPAQSVQHFEKRCAHRNQFENAIFSAKKGLFSARESPTQQRAVRCRFGASSIFRHKVTTSSIYANLRPSQHLRSVRFGTL